MSIFTVALAILVSLEFFISCIWRPLQQLQNQQPVSLT